MENYTNVVLLPSDDKTEKTVIGTIIASNERFAEVEDILSEKVFYNEINKWVFRCTRYLITNNKIADLNSIIATLKKYKLPIEITEYDVMEIAAYESADTLQQDSERICDYARRRESWTTLQESAKQTLELGENIDETIGALATKIEEIRNNATADTGIITSNDALKELNAVVADNLAGKNNQTVKSGFRFTDSKGGIRLGSLSIIGAFTSVGKTSLALKMMLNMAKMGIPVAYYSLEMSAVELWARLVAIESGIPANRILNYGLVKEELEEFDKTLQRLKDLPIYIDDKATTKFSKMLRSVRKLVKTKSVKVFYVDYLQIFAQNNSDSEESALSGMVRALKNISRELNIVSVALSQLRRGHEDKHPSIDMLRGSGQIEESADNVFLIDRPDAHPDWGVTKFSGRFRNVEVDGKAEINVAKGRNMGLGQFLISFDPERTNYYETDGFDYRDSQDLNTVDNKNELPF